MIPVEDLRAENDKIEALIDVLINLVPNQKLRTNEIFCDLLQRFHEMLESHIKHEARSIYPELLSHDDKKIKQIAKAFLSNTHELERIMSKYIKRWCHYITTENHDEFEQETLEVFRLVKERIQMEETHLFSIV